MRDDTERTVLEQDDRDWPDKLPAHQWRAPRTAYTRVRPDLVVEVSADLALDGLRWPPRRPGLSPRNGSSAAALQQATPNSPGWRLCVGGCGDSARASVQ
jgi:hypothetical protein